MSSQPRCPHCRHFVYLDTLTCPNCEGELGYNIETRLFHGVRNGRADIEGRAWYTCSNREWSCNWLVRDDAPAGRCFSCRLTRRRPAADDTVALEKLAKTEEAKRRLLLQLGDLGLPIVPWDVRKGGLGFDLISSLSDGKRVMIGHSNGIITIDLAESLDDRREALRVRLGEPYRTMLGHLRHEVGHYFQNVLLTDDDLWARCRALFGDERESYRDAISRHYKLGAPANWKESFISEYATMHPWEDFAETWAHYLHITGTLQTAAVIGINLDASVSNLRDTDVVPLESYRSEPIQRLLTDWEWMSQGFNRINRAMGFGDLYPFRIPVPVRRKLEFVHDIVTRAPLTFEEQYALAFAEEPERA
ncbi:zinc-binding metallopeptidase family protein [Microbacterium sp. CFBP9034]|uniref:zinc-binding metallopeptidase family protein n=1 Tax=Microbacterium sp. CFBP9034 TaxID=3096540 RepID=UPI002A6A328B|nr:putative zinc-binding metallopeptidase [Microbacterium sp. CFBP9034]MDY0909628.1 putative zinc-binding metallopeptidase [Microbacterium sp. CFBP9034]